MKEEKKPIAFNIPTRIEDKYKSQQRKEGFSTLSAWIISTLNKALTDSRPIIRRREGEDEIRTSYEVEKAR